MREVKYLLMLRKSDIPDSALAIFGKRDTVLKVCVFTYCPETL